MKIIINPATENWPDLLKRPEIQKENLQALMAEVFSAVEASGDEALRNYSIQFDGVAPDEFEVRQDEFVNAEASLSRALKDAILLASRNIEKFHRAQQEQIRVVETSPGVRCWRASKAIEKVGLYIPGGTAPLFSTVLMLGIPAKIAGCSEIVLCTPPDKSGKIHPAILFAAHTVGIRRVMAVGGIQAIAALSLGSKSIPRVDKLFGPGNQYVNAAKQFAQQWGVAIDLPAGPSELLIIADQTANPAFVASDLLSQAEHGPDSQVVLLTNDPDFAQSVMLELSAQLEQIPRKEIAQQALQQSKCIVFPNLETCFRWSNLYAPEHLIVAVENYSGYTDQIINAGSVFLGNYSCESAGDYASGTNHTLPTNGFARNYSGVSLDSFLKKITFQELSAEGLLTIGPAIEAMAEAEQLEAHKNAVSIRIQYLQSNG